MMTSPHATTADRRFAPVLCSASDEAEDRTACRILSDAINDGALDANCVSLAGYGFALAATNDRKQCAVACRGGWMLIPGEVIAHMMSKLNDADQATASDGRPLT